MPCARICSRSFTGMASMRSITITSRVHQSKYTSGHVEDRAAGEVAPHRAHAGGLAQEVQLVVDDLVELVHHLARAQQVARADAALDEARHDVEDPVSLSMVSTMCGRRIFTATSRPSGSSAKCTCATEALATRRQVEGAEHFRVGLAVGAVQRLDDLLRRERRDAVLQLRELVGDVGGDEVRADRQELPELHEDRAQLLEGDAQPHAARPRPVGPEEGHAEGEAHERGPRPTMNSSRPWRPIVETMRRSRKNRMEPRFYREGSYPLPSVEGASSLSS